LVPRHTGIFTSKSEMLVLFPAIVLLNIALHRQKQPARSALPFSSTELIVPVLARRGDPSKRRSVREDEAVEVVVSRCTEDLDIWIPNIFGYRGFTITHFTIYLKW
jgi:hypothetical protein